MAVRYSIPTSRTGVTIGTVVSIPKPDSWANSTNLTTETNNWNVGNDYPGWLPCDGRTLNVLDYKALFDVIGTTYGGTGGATGTFKLPDYRSRKLMGTGAVALGQSLTLTPDLGPGGGSQADINTPGSTGGLYTMTTSRQLPPGSEITPGGALKPDVFFDVGGNVLGRPIEFLSGSAYQNYGTGIGETGGFLEPPTTNGGRYIGLGTTGTSPFNSTQYTREVRITNLDLTGYGVVRIFAIAGNEANGGERVNNVGEGLRVIWPNGAESVILPSALDVGGLEIFDEAYSSWREIAIDIPSQYRTTGVTIRFRQDLNASTNNPPGQQEGDHNLTDPNAYDMIGIQKIGFSGGEIGGAAADTFTLGSYRTQGFSGSVVNGNATINGNISYSAGPVSARSVNAPAPHLHAVRYIQATGGFAAEGDGARFCTGSNGGFKNVPFFNNEPGAVVQFSREGRGLRTHSHYIYWESEAATAYSSYGHDNTVGNSGLVNPLQGSGFTAFATNYNITNNRGTTINKTLSMNDIAVTINDSTITLKDSTKTDWENALDLRLEAAEEIPLMTAYVRVKYIIKAF
jgi:hypothetical protein